MAQHADQHVRSNGQRVHLALLPTSAQAS
jgi:hypothetical protein